MKFKRAMATVAMVGWLTLGASIVPATTGEQTPVFLGKWGTCGSGDQNMQDPLGITVDGEGSVFVCDFGNDRVLKFSGTGTLLAKLGDGGIGDCLFPADVDMTTDGLIAVSDSGGRRMRFFDSNFNLIRRWPPVFGSFRMAVSPVDNYVYLTLDSHIFRYSPNGVELNSWSAGSEEGEFRDIAVGPDGSVFGADPDDLRVFKFTSNGALLAEWTGLRAFSVGVTDDNEVYIGEETGIIRKFTTSGTLVSSFGDGVGSGDGEFRLPSGIDFDGQGAIYITDNDNCRVQRFGAPPVATAPTSWGRLKSKYR